uniref:CSC1/OSCA1-like 7TM region domain-containing protein n=1 Tax=Chromera velia CCMP2878 TaxID=1169474 RepID=A0A0G4HT77_9ALVE|eukprot:Cvel_8397.t1-p1 / transcript=Cvel_8397.t1 / gene=Cvel_8397 / organism=Chromera_velia_CCMP2878 / gene_product=hypothetical protein / transcript_product=hypothetical protein / location=Cvel_scaffold463:69063-79410(-) / protein_length=744 / sequence_SO=supercontig / SO=protein_coding / is_pseudo=false
MGCKPIELAELGAGFPLYFELLKYLAFLMIILSCLAAGLVGIYANGDNLGDYSDNGIRGLPDDAIDEEELVRFFAENGTTGPEELPVVKVGGREGGREGVVLGFNIAELMEKQRLLVQVGGLGGECLAGYAIVIFKYQHDQRKVLKNWTKTWRAKFNRWTFGCVKSGNPKFRSTYELKLSRAPNPDDLLWENMGYSSKTRALAQLKTGLILFALVALSFGAVFGLTYLNREVLKGQNPWVAIAISCAITIPIVSTNMGIRMAIQRLVPQLRKQTRTEQDASEVSWTVLTMTINTGLLQYLVNLQPENWFVMGGLAWNIFIQLCVASFIGPLFGFIPFFRWIRTIKIGSIDPETTKMTQPMFNALHEGPDFRAPFRYSNALKHFIVAVLYLPLVPLGVIISFPGLILQFWSDKWFLLRECKRPYNQSSRMAHQALKIIRFACIFFSLFTFLFLSTAAGGAQNATVLGLFIISISVSTAVFLIPVSFLRWLFCTGICQRDPVKDAAFEDLPNYYVAQGIFARDFKYHMTNPIYKRLPASANPENIPDPDADEDIENTGQHPQHSLPARGASSIKQINFRQQRFDMDDQQNQASQGGAMTGATFIPLLLTNQAQAQNTVKLHQPTQQQQANIQYTYPQQQLWQQQQQNQPPRPYQQQQSYQQQQPYQQPYQQQHQQPQQYGQPQQQQGQQVIRVSNMQEAQALAARLAQQRQGGNQGGQPAAQQYGLQNHAPGQQGGPGYPGQAGWR